MLNKAHVIEIAKACTVAFMKARNSVDVRCREKLMKIYYLKLLLTDFG